MDKLYTDEELRLALEQFDVTEEPEWSKVVIVKNILNAVLPAYLNRLADDVEQAHRDTPDCGYAGVIRLLRAKAEETP